jgi:DNA replication initiation complex subunit (GINS family)
MSEKKLIELLEKRINGEKIELPEVSKIGKHLWRRDKTPSTKLIH